MKSNLRPVSNLRREEPTVDPEMFTDGKAKASRRKFLKGMAVGVGAAYVGLKASKTVSANTPTTWVKDPTPFHQFPTNLETPLELIQHSFVTPTELFFVRNNVPFTPQIDPETYRLRIEGDGVEREIELTLKDIMNLPSVSIPRNVECGGNWRSFYDRVQGRPASGGQWGSGGISLAYWTGTPLSEVLKLAGVKDDAVDVLPIGLDDLASEGGFQRHMSLDKALQSDTILAYRMNGEVLPADHGFPLRAIVPGWVGSNSIKWLGRIVVSTKVQWTRNATIGYVLIDPEEKRWQPSPDAPEGSLGAPVYDQSLKSALALPWDGEIERGRRMIRGFASPGLHDWNADPTWTPKMPRKVAKVEWRVNGGAWQQARLIDPVIPGVWTRFEFEWDATPGKHIIETRATDELGLSQPDVAPYNEKGYLMNQVLPHPIHVV